LSLRFAGSPKWQIDSKSAFVVLVISSRTSPVVPVLWPTQKFCHDTPVFNRVNWYVCCSCCCWWRWW